VFGARYFDVQTFKAEAAAGVAATCALALVVAAASREAAPALLALFGGLVAGGYLAWARCAGGALDAHHPLVRYALEPTAEACAALCSVHGRGRTPYNVPLRPIVDAASELCAVVSEFVPPAGGNVDGQTAFTRVYEVVSWTVLQLTLELAAGGQVVAVLDPSVARGHSDGGEALEGKEGSACEGSHTVLQSAFKFVELLTSSARDV
jgi:hypothetical protein